MAFASLPDDLRAVVGDLCGGEVLAVDDRPSGFSPGVAAVVGGDNLLVHEGVGVLVDWPWASRGHPLLDLVVAAPALAMQGGPPPAELLARSTVGRQAEPDRLRPLVVAVAGMFPGRSRRPPPPGLPTLRAFQAAQAQVALEWLRPLVT